MTKTKKILLLLGVFVLLLGAYLALTLPGKQSIDPPAADEGAEEMQTYDFFALNPDGLVAFSYTHDGQEYAYTLSADKARWHWEGDPTLPLSNGQITRMMNAVLTLSSEVRYTDVAADTLADYGLGSTAQRVTFRYADGEEDGLIFGKINAFNGMAYCCRGEDTSTVYMVSASILPYFAVKPTNMIENDVLPTYTDEQFLGYELQMGGVGYLYAHEYLSESVSAEDERQLVFYPAEGEPMLLESEVRDTVLETVRSWRLDGAWSFDPDDYEQYGVTDDAADRLRVQYTFTQSYTDETTGTTNSTEMQTMYTLLLGKTTEDGLTYVRLSDAAGVYALDLSLLFSLIEQTNSSMQ